MQLALVSGTCKHVLSFITIVAGTELSTDYLIFLLTGLDEKWRQNFLNTFTQLVNSLFLIKLKKHILLIQLMNAINDFIWVFGKSDKSISMLSSLEWRDKGP